MSGPKPLRLPAVSMLQVNTLQLNPLGVVAYQTAPL